MLEPSVGWAADPDPLPCRRFDAELWFAETETDISDAKALCSRCPVRSQCLASALQRREPWGVWGGELLERGAVIERKRQRGRPRKSSTSDAAVAA
ncbi:MAG: WhiB family transcriptional regulator [Angustibacter sp.]